jgi:hypothetical protein
MMEAIVPSSYRIVTSMIEVINDDFAIPLYSLGFSNATLPYDMNLGLRASKAISALGSNAVSQFNKAGSYLRGIGVQITTCYTTFKDRQPLLLLQMPTNNCVFFFKTISPEFTFFEHTNSEQQNISIDL